MSIEFNWKHAPLFWNQRSIKLSNSVFISFQVSAGGNQSTDEKTGRSYLLSFQEVLCDLGQHSVSSVGDPYSNRSFTHAIYELQISNDQRTFSKKKVPYIIYDSKCMECNINSLKCSQKVCSKRLLFHYTFKGTFC